MRPRFSTALFSVLSLISLFRSPLWLMMPCVRDPNFRSQSELCSSGWRPFCCISSFWLHAPSNGEPYDDCKWRILTSWGKSARIKSQHGKSAAFQRDSIQTCSKYQLWYASNWRASPLILFVAVICRTTTPHGSTPAMSNLCSIIVPSDWIPHWLAYSSNWLIWCRFTLISSFHCSFYVVTVTSFISIFALSWMGKNVQKYRNAKLRARNSEKK